MRFLPGLPIVFAVLAGIQPAPALTGQMTPPSGSAANLAQAKQKGLDWLTKNQAENGSWGKTLHPGRHQLRLPRLSFGKRMNRSRRFTGQGIAQGTGVSPCQSKGRYVHPARTLLDSRPGLRNAGPVGSLRPLAVVQDQAGHRHQEASPGRGQGGGHHRQEPSRIPAAGGTRRAI